MRYRVLVSSPNNLFEKGPSKFIVSAGFVFADDEEQARAAAERSGMTTMFGFKFEGVQPEDQPIPVPGPPAWADR